MKLTYYKELDGVRAIAALMVMFFHFFQGGVTTNAALYKISIFGQTGVSLFFVLSGFLITRILLFTKESPGYFSNFYIRRTLRIFPLYYLFLCISYYLLPLLMRIPISPFRLQVYDWIYLQDFARTFKWKFVGPEHFWSLAVEEHFYLFWPLIIYFSNLKGIRASIIVIILLSFIVRIWLVRNNFEVYYFTFSRMDELALGAFLATFEKERKLNENYSNRFLLLFISVMLPTLMIWSFFTGSGNAVVQVFKFNLISLAYFSFIGYIVTIGENNPIKRLFKKGPLLYTGKISYGLYVYHPICFGIFFQFFKSRFMLINLIGCFGLAYLCAGLSYQLFEMKFLNLKKYFNYKKAVLRPIVQEY